MKTKTPITDAEAKRVRLNEDELTEPVSANFARRFEIELADKNNWAIKACAEISRLRTAIRETLEENAHLADGDVCTLIKLKRAAAWPNGELCRVRKTE